MENKDKLMINIMMVILTNFLRPIYFGSTLWVTHPLKYNFSCFQGSLMFVLFVAKVENILKIDKD